ncbi:uracil-DNA glycosylase, partial [Phenoliferia sp. Uapishka_3]
MSGTLKRQIAAVTSPLAKRPRLSESPARVTAAAVLSSDASSNARSAFAASLATAPASGRTVAEKDLLKLECETMDESWLALLETEIRKDYFLSLKSFLWTEGVRGVGDSKKGKVFPAAEDIYAWSRYAPIHNVRVVIIGQDPYHDDAGQAHGLCFSVQPGVKVPPSLRNIYKEIQAEYPDFTPPKHGNLVSLAKSGVLLLNTSLTVRAHAAGSHSKKGWETFTDKVVDLVDQYGGADGVGEKGNGVVFLAWGAWAAKRVEKLDKTKHLILTCAHPSPLSARRGFFGCDHFKKSNEWLEKKYGEDGKIAWTKLDPEPADSLKAASKS